MVPHFLFPFASFLMNFMMFWRSLSHDCDLGNHDKAKHEGRFCYNNMTMTEKRHTSSNSARRDDSFGLGFSLLAGLDPKIWIDSFVVLLNRNKNSEPNCCAFLVLICNHLKHFLEMKKHLYSSIFGAKFVDDELFDKKLHYLWDFTHHPNCHKYWSYSEAR